MGRKRHQRNSPQLRQPYKQRPPRRVRHRVKLAANKQIAIIAGIAFTLAMIAVGLDALMN